MKEEDGTTAPQSGGKRRVRALYDYKPQKMGDMRFQKGEVMMLLVDSTHDNWWAVRHADGREGFVPSNYVTLDDTVTRQYLGLDVAVRMREAEREPAMSVDEFLEAVDLLKKFRHDKLEHVFGVHTKAEPMCVVIEWMSQGSLLEYLREGKGTHVDLPCLIDMAAQVASGLSYLGHNGCIHMDVAARSILVGDNNVAKLMCFGDLRVTDEDGEYLREQDKKFPIKWTAPEAAFYGKCNTMSTVWSFGVLLQEIMTRGQVPYPGMNNRETLEKVEKGYRMAKCPSTPELLYKLQLACWEREPRKRPTFAFLANCLSDYSTLTKSVSTSS
ncbi:proto-oncogene tyrosine-protein kinase Yrk-like isoform X2 [Babylonia areolata]|uniref:proto-oncogene tyrosine-protein kinase Yrk-like isoform X2 n=1 Tax=Babylonia areolata TaxID=304850 RepID=UPI003FD5D22F